MNTIVPDKFIRKEIYDRIHNMDINGTMFKCFDTRTTASNQNFYTILSTQLNQPLPNKCGNGWENSTEIQVITRYSKNVGSRVMLDDAVNEVIEELSEFSLPSTTGLKVNEQQLSIDNEIVNTERGEVVYTKVIRLQTTIN